MYIKKEAHYNTIIPKRLKFQSRLALTLAIAAKQSKRCSGFGKSLRGKKFYSWGAATNNASLQTLCWPNLAYKEWTQ